jgi:phage gp29-like protein
MAEKKTKAPAKPELDTEVANRLRDPFETSFLGVVQSNDPLLLEKGQHVELYRDLKRDGKVFSALQRRIGALIGREWTVKAVAAGGEADAKTLTDILQAINFDQLCRDLLDALIMGYSVSEIIYTVVKTWIVPKRIIKRRQRRFVYVQADENSGPELRLLTRENMLTGVELPDKKFIVHRCNPEDDNPYGTGLGLQLYWPVFFKRKGIIAWNKLNDRFGTPTPWGRYPRGATQKEKSTLFDALKAFSNDGVVMTPEGMAIELLESKLTGSITTHEALCGYMDDWIAEVVLGQEPRAQGGGALAAASKERQAVRLDLVQADSDLLSETLNSTLIAWLCEYNGLAPCLVYRQIKEEEDKKAESEADKNVSDMGFELEEEAVREKYGDGWRKKAAPTPPVVDNRNGGGGKQPPGDPANFAEPAGLLAGQRAIDAAVAAMPNEALQAAVEGLLAPLLAAIDGAKSFEEALAAAEAAYPDMDPAKLQHLLATAMFSAEAYGRQEAIQ